jgi:hypothetical protein
VDKSSRQIEKIAKCEINFEKRGRRHIAPRIKGLTTMRQGKGWFVDSPVFAARNLKYEHVMRIVVRTEAGGIARSDVDVSVHGMVEIFLNSGGERAERLPCAMEGRQRNSGVGLIFGTNPIETWYTGENVIARPDVPGECLRGKEPTVPG